MIVGYEPETDFVIAPWIVESADRHGNPAADDAVVGADILAGIGGRLKFYGREFRVSGKLDRTGLRYLDSGVFIPMEGVRRMIAESGDRALKRIAAGTDEISSVLIKLEQDMNPDVIALLIEHDFPDRKALVASNVVRKSANILAVPLRGMEVLFVLQCLASVLLIAVVQKHAVDARRTELGIMKALGATDGKIRRLLLIEISLLSGAAALDGIACGYLGVKAFAGAAGLTMHLPLLLPGWSASAAVACCVFVGSVAAGVLPSLFSMRRVALSEPYYLMQGGLPGLKDPAIDR